MSIDEIEGQLRVAHERMQAATRACRTSWNPDTAAEYWAAQDVALALERELAAATGEEYAVPLNFPVKWDAGCPMPHLFRNDGKALLTFYVREDQPEWDGSTVELIDPAAKKAVLLALVEFSHCGAAKLGSPNDEVWEGHPLYGKGLDGYTAQKVENSRWLAEIEAINKVHRCYNPASWRELNHYIFWFHDTTFDCLAKSFEVEIHRESMAAMLGRVCQRLLS